MYFTAMLLGLIEGVTEFLPVSSTGHLIIFGRLLGFPETSGKSFEIIIQLGAILAICWLYRQKIASTFCGVLKGKPDDRQLAGGVLIAFLPALVLGLLLHEFITSTLFNPACVSVALIAGGIIILITERFKPPARYEILEQIPFSVSLKIGLCQCVALIPGTSRSGATIIGALLLGVDRKAATEFSFFLAIPTMFAATTFDLYQSWHLLSADDLELIVIGFVSAFASALLVVRWMIGYVTRHGFEPFAWYRIVLGIVMLIVFA